MTSDEFALEVVKSCSGVSAWELDYKISEEPHLLGMMVTGTKAELSVVARARPRPNTALRDARDALGEDGQGRPRGGRGYEQRASQWKGGQRGSHSKGGKGRAGQQANIEDGADDPPTMGDAIAFESDDDEGVLELSPEDAVDILEAYGLAGPEDSAHCADDAGALGHAGSEEKDTGLVEICNALAEAPELDDATLEVEDDTMVGQAASETAAEPKPEDMVSGPNQMGYLNSLPEGRVLARITAVFNRSVAIKCYVHPGRCSVAVAEWKLPDLTSLRRWAGGAVPHQLGATPDQKQQEIRAHKAELEALIRGATRPGRTRQSLLDEAMRLDS